MAAVQREGLRETVSREGGLRLMCGVFHFRLAFFVDVAAVVVAVASGPARRTLPSLGCLALVPIKLYHLVLPSPSELTRSQEVYRTSSTNASDVIRRSARLADCLSASCALHARAIVRAVVDASRTSGTAGTAGSSDTSMVKLAGGERRFVGVLKLLWVTAHNRQVMLAGSSSQEHQQSPMEELQGVLKAMLKSTVVSSALSQEIALSLTRDAATTTPVAKPVKKEFESQHPYPSRANSKTKIHLPGATRLHIAFDPMCHTEANYDWLGFFRTEECNSSDIIARVSGPPGVNWQDIDVPGDTVWLQFQSDGSNCEWGYKFTVTGLTGDLGGDSMLVSDAKVLEGSPLFGVWVLGFLVEVGHPLAFSQDVIDALVTFLLSVGGVAVGWHLAGWLGGWLGGWLAGRHWQLSCSCGAWGGVVTVLRLFVCCEKACG